MTDSLLPDVGVTTHNRDVFAEFDESRVKAVIRDSSMPAKVSLGSKAPDILSWPPKEAAILASGSGDLTLHLYRHACSC